MNKEPCIICEREAICSAVTGQADTCEYRCDNCGNYFFRNDQNKEEYEKLDSEETERILNYVREYDEAKGEWATLGDLKRLWQEIEDFNREKSKT